MTNSDAESTVGQDDMSRSLTGYDASRLNAVRHGILSRHTVLPWEDESEYQALLDELTEEHRPSGPTETHLVVELTGVLWRKRRLRLAEAATYRKGLQYAIATQRDTAATALVHLEEAEQSEGVADAIRTTSEATASFMADMAADEAMTHRALELLGSQRNDAYEAAVQALHEDTQGWWARELARDPKEFEDDEAPPAGDSDGLRRFIEEQVLPWFEARRREIANRPLIREQAFGESLDTGKLERLGRYETFLDRKLERTLSTLMRLQELRRGRSAPASG